MEDLCTGCLSKGRKLSTLAQTDYYSIYTQILNEIPVYDLSRIIIRICWECKCLLRKMHNFKQQVKHSYMLLMQNISQASISRLTSHIAFSLSYPEEQIKTEDDVEIKEETHSEHAFVNDFSFQDDDFDCVPEETKPEKKTKKKKIKKTNNKVKVKKRKKDKMVEENVKIDDSDTKTEVNEKINELNDKIVGDNGKMNEVNDAIDEVNDEMNEVNDKINEMNEVTIEIKIPIEEKIENDIVPHKEVLPRKKRDTTVLPDKPQCVECGKMFSSRKTYRYHLNVLHKGQNQFPCPRCGKIYQWKSNLARHMRTHKAVDAGELYCETCDKVFASIATYKQHLKISRPHVSESEFSYICNECGKKFVTKVRLRDHIDWEHLKKIKFRCTACNKPFKCKTSLYVHMQNVHTNKEKKDNLCHVCGKSYQNAAKLKYHITALHSGETPYRCAQCAAAFGWYSSLYRHTREVHYKMKIQPKKVKKAKKLSGDIVPSVPNHTINNHYIVLPLQADT